MADAKSIIAAIKATKPMDLVHNPFAFAVGVGVANGLLAVARNKRIDLPTASALGVILGLGEAALVGLEPGNKVWSKETGKVALWSVLGVAVGVAPFMLFGGEGSAHAIPVAEKVRETKGEAVA
jgi:hypothetical protein